MTRDLLSLPWSISFIDFFLLFSKNAGTVPDADVLELVLKELTLWMEENNHKQWQRAG